MKAAVAIREHIHKIPLGRPFTAVSFRNCASYDNIRQVLLRLVKSGEITRAARGVFVRPRVVPYLGKVLPDTREIANTIAQSTGETLEIHGAEAARILQLSTQVPMHNIFLTTGASRRIKIGKREIIFKHASPRKMVKPGTTVGLVISAFWYLGKDYVNPLIIEKIKKQIKAEEFNNLLKEIPSMPAWMANVFYLYQQRKTNG